MKTEIGICKGCGKNKPIVNRTHYLCPECNNDRKSEHKAFLGIESDTETEKTTLHTTTGSAFVKQAKNKPTGEWALFMSIWATRPHVSQLSGRPIEEPRPENFIHILAKGLNKFPKFKLYDKNIQIGTGLEHHLYDNGTIESRARYREQCLDEGFECDWQKWFTLRDELKNEYKCL